MEDHTIRKRVRKLLFSNFKEGYSKLLKENYCYMQPSAGKYPFQWFWDSFFHIYILCALHEYDHAKRCLKSLFAMQEFDGFVGHMIYWKSILPPSIWNVLQSRPTLKQFRPHMSALIQPTFAAQSLEQIYNDTKDENFLSEVLPKVKRYHEWLIVNRCFEDDGLIFIISPFESGIDEKPSYDALIGSSPRKGTFRQYLQLTRIDALNFLRRYRLPDIYRANNFIVKDTAMNTIYTLDLFALGRLCKKQGDQINALRFDNLAHKVSKSILDLMYNEEDNAFYDLEGHDNKQIRVLTFSIFFPMALPGISPDITKRLIEKHLLNKNEFNLPYPVPSIAKSEKSFTPTEAASNFFDFLWRGPTWIFVNWFLYKFLLTKGYEDEAEKLLLTVKKLIEKSGFREYYNPFTGEGYGAKDFTWGGLVLDMMRQKEEIYSKQFH